MWISEQAQVMETHALFYQQAITRALGSEARKQLNAGYHPLSDGLAKIVGWRKRWAAANETDRISRTMYLDWLATVGEAASIYDDWSSQYLQEKWFGQAAQEAPEVRAG